LCGVSSASGAQRGGTVDTVCGICVPVGLSALDEALTDAFRSSCL